MLVAEPSAEVADVPAAGGVFGDDRVRGLGQDLLVERVSEDLADRKRDRPVFEDPLDVQIETLRAAA